MTDMATIKLQAHKVHFFSPCDEEAFFEWLNKLHCVAHVTGRGKVLNISIRTAAVDEDALRELLALFRRYNVDMKQLSVLDRSEFAQWFRDPRGYWFDAVFGA